MTSNDFATLLQRQRDDGTADLAFVIGGPTDTPRRRATAPVSSCPSAP